MSQALGRDGGGGLLVLHPSPTPHPAVRPAPLPLHSQRPVWPTPARGPHTRGPGLLLAPFAPTRLAAQGPPGGHPRQRRPQSRRPSAQWLPGSEDVQDPEHGHPGLSWAAPPWGDRPLPPPSPCIP
ncbi:proline-rich protein 2-like [Bos indicus x Bos taurus]|uniref:proline-rich protein 2-like n=1 Tax=Bos indicus x Bos taurus TaxID=30522 RepID=UPI000F7D19F7|nr:proline-rich protein 2-like [Bos indicus x Bos taurus]